MFEANKIDKGIELVIIKFTTKSERRELLLMSPPNCIPSKNKRNMIRKMQVWTCGQTI